MLGFLCDKLRVSLGAEHLLKESRRDHSPVMSRVPVSARSSPSQRQCLGVFVVPCKSRVVICFSARDARDPEPLLGFPPCFWISSPYQEFLSSPPKITTLLFKKSVPGTSNPVSLSWKKTTQTSLGTIETCHNLRISQTTEQTRKTYVVLLRLEVSTRKPHSCHAGYHLTGI